MLTHIRIDKKMDRALDSILPDTYFKNKSEFIRDAIRKSLENYKTLKKLHELKGSSSGFKASSNQRLNFFKEFGEEITNSQGE